MSTSDNAENSQSDSDSDDYVYKGESKSTTKGSKPKNLAKPAVKDCKPKCVNKPCSPKSTSKDYSSKSVSKDVKPRSPKSTSKECKQPKECKDACFLQCMSFIQSTKDIIVPPGATHMKVLLIGAGGGGGDYKSVDDTVTNGGGGGGAGGTYVNEHFDVQAGQTFTITIGQGGVGGGSYGTSGGDTSLVYGAHTKVANGGKGGGYGLSGSFGGKGGEGTGHGKMGDNGANGTPNTGGAGGKTKICRCQSFQYGNGGMGGSAEPVGLVVNSSSYKVSDFLTRLPNKDLLSVCKQSTEVKCCQPLSVCGCHTKEKEEGCHCCCPPDPLVPTPNPVGDTGMSGYAELKFYGCLPQCQVECSKVQHIIPCGSNYVYYIDPNAVTLIVDSSNFIVNTFLSTPSKNGHKIDIRMMYQHGLQVNIQTITGGTFSLSSSNPRVLMVYADGVWDVLENFQQLHSFYPTKQHQRVLTMLGLINPTNVGFPYSTAISANGCTIIVGVPSDSQSIGAGFIFTRVDDCWKYQTKLIPNDPNLTPTPSFVGVSVAISADGNTVAIGGNGDNNFTGAVWIFVRCDGTWTQQGTKIVAAVSAPGDEQGISVALNSNGNILAVGASHANSDVGEVIVYTRTMGVWSQQTIIPGNFLFGIAVSLSSVGDVLAIGSTETATSIYRNIGGVWTLDTIIPYNVYFNGSVDLSADGNTVAIGTERLGTIGAVVIYVYSGNTWVQQGIPLEPNNNIGAQIGFGFAVSLSGDGNTLAVGGISDNNFVGATWIFTRESGLWQQKEKLIGTSSIPSAQQGSTVALSSEGGILAVTNLAFPLLSNPVPLLWIFT